MKVHLIKIGNSQGIRIPKPFIEQAGLTDEVEIEAQPGRLIVRPARISRQGWEAQFQAMAEASEDHMLDAEPLQLTEWEAKEWEW